MNLAIFDLDHTLLNGDSDYAWGQFLVEQNIVDGQEYETINRNYYEQYRQGTLDILEFLAFALQPLTQHDFDTLNNWHRQFMQQKIEPMISQAAQALVNKHRQQSDTLLIITATNSFVTAPIARAFDIDNIIATEPEIKDGRYTGRVSGTPCFREGKVQRLQAWLSSRDEAFDQIWFYTDSHNDLPLLELVDHPVVVNPDDILRQHAQEQRWPIMTL
ncbi:MAG TPA: HAD family hydrolase [Acidiferrobacteraceae bacterium]|jgi:HAD superfamily hydrolase (TIGR01490 family)|nr:HAD family hydrolase [Acidiferrobacteraceae bacterium]HEX20229.1 HAD family hydrolase [Acidiferrobacteraceae bacterium]